MNKKWILIPCFFLVVLAISLMIAKSEPVYENAGKVKLSSYNGEIKNYSIYSISVFDASISQRLMHLTSEEEIKESIDHLLSLKVTTEENVLQDETTYMINFHPIRKENNITYIDEYYFYISKNFIYDRPFEYYSLNGENVLYDYIQSELDKESK